VKRKYWVYPIFSSKKRQRHGASRTLIRELYFHNDEKFINYFLINVKTYKKLLNIIGIYITKKVYSSPNNVSMSPVPKYHAYTKIA